MSSQAQRHCANLEMATGWALHALEPADEAAFARHLPTCAECAAEVQATEDLAVWFAADVEQVEPPARLRDAVLNAARSPQVPRQHRPAGMTSRETSPVDAGTTGAEIDAPADLGTAGEEIDATADAAVPSLAERRSRRNAGRLASRRALLATAAVLVLVFGGALGWLGSSLVGQPGSTSTNALTEQNVLTALTDPAVQKVALTDKGSSTTMALLLAGPNTATVVPVNMPNTAGNAQYVLWGVPAGADAKPVALGGVPGSGEARSVAGAADPAGFTTFAVSVEPAGPVPASPSAVVASGQARA